MDGAFSFGFILLSIWISLPVIITEIVHWEMSRTCGATIAREKMFGGVTFNPSFATRDFTHNYCTLYVTPKKLDQDKTSPVVVYFTEFDVGDDCNRGGLTMYDTYDKTLVTYSRAGMCGRNDTLTDGSTVFIVKHGTLILNYTWTSGNFDEHSHDFFSTFSLKFSSFYKYTDTDDCSGKDFHQCSNSRCVHSDAYCRTDMNGCGYTLTDQCERDAEAVAVTETDFLTTIVNTIEQYAWMLVIGIAIYVVITCLRNPRSPLRRSHIGQRLFDRLCCNLERSATRDLYETSPMNEQTDVVQETDLNQLYVEVETSSSISSDQNITQRAESPTRSLRLEDETNLPSSTLPSVPPPSYDEVAAPSYEHYMSNQGIYKASDDKS